MVSYSVSEWQIWSIYDPRSEKILASEYAKSRLLNKDSRFRKDLQYIFFLLWQKEMTELSAGVYNLMKGTLQQQMPVQVFLNKVSKSNQDVEGNLSTIFHIQLESSAVKIPFLCQGKSHMSSLIQSS